MATSIEAMLAGSAVIYLFGVTWLAHSLSLSTTRAIELGMAPFLVGDAVKVVLAGVLLPVAWRVVGSKDR